ncbi:MAG: hypothetical protein HY552_00275 [Elusimicrobia bacterium]|nr:hypothetical protein [Elusimicrobiota bacterium]
MRRILLGLVLAVSAGPAVRAEDFSDAVRDASLALRQGLPRPMRPGRYEIGASFVSETPDALQALGLDGSWMRGFTLDAFSIGPDGYSVALACTAAEDARAYPVYPGRHGWLLRLAEQGDGYVLVMRRPPSRENGGSWSPDAWVSVRFKLRRGDRAVDPGSVAVEGRVRRVEFDERNAGGRGLVVGDVVYDEALKFARRL